MSALDITFKIDGVAVLDRRLRGIIYDIQNIQPALADIEDYTRSSWVANFEAEGRPKKWDGLSPVTIARRKSDHPILQDTGDLLRSVEGKGADSISVKNNRSIRFGVNGIKAVATNYRVYDGKSARQWFMLQPLDKTNIIRILRLHVMKEGKK